MQNSNRVKGPGKPCRRRYALKRTNFLLKQGNVFVLAGPARPGMPAVAGIAWGIAIVIWVYILATRVYKKRK